MTTRYEQGMKVRREVLGDEHVNRAVEAGCDLDNAFQKMITEGAWGTVWASDGIPVRERSMLTLALLAGLGNLEEFGLHLRATARTGVSASDVAEIIQHVAIYAGVPRANQAMKMARTILLEEGVADVESPGDGEEKGGRK